jgi:hypothetical protein
LKVKTTGRRNADGMDERTGGNGLFIKQTTD